MSDEIKEILDNFKDYELRYKQCNENQFIIFYRDIHLLLNYITNLQTIEREYSSLLSENAELQQENDRLNNIINELERRFNQELELNNKWEVEDTQKFYSKKWYRDVLRDFKNMIKRIKGE